MGVLPRFATGGFLRSAKEKAAVEPPFRAMAVKAANLAAPVSSLSGGNQQKVLLAKCLLADPEVIFLDDPARGIDVGAKQEIYELLFRQAERGLAVLVVSSELPELLYLADRILVMCEGRPMGTLARAEATKTATRRWGTLASSLANSKAAP